VAIVVGKMLIPDTFGITQVITTAHYIRKGELQVSNYLREQIDRKKKEIELQKQASNIYTIHPRRSELILLYEVVDESGRAEWGGANAEQAIQWLTLAPADARILVSAWDSDEEDAHLVGQTIDITEIVRAASL
jgi:single-stranded DNA-binding protein